MYSTPFQNAKLVLFFQIPKCFDKKKRYFFYYVINQFIVKEKKGAWEKHPLQIDIWMLGIENEAFF